MWEWHRQCLCDCMPRLLVGPILDLRLYSSQLRCQSITGKSQFFLHVLQSEDKFHHAYVLEVIAGYALLVTYI
jgi:hypothetical protein